MLQFSAIVHNNRMFICVLHACNFMLLLLFSKGYKKLKLRRGKATLISKGKESSHPSPTLGRNKMVIELNNAVCFYQCLFVVVF